MVKRGSNGIETLHDLRCFQRISGASNLVVETKLLQCINHKGLFYKTVPGLVNIPNGCLKVALHEFCYQKSTETYYVKRHYGELSRKREIRKRYYARCLGNLLTIDFCELFRDRLLVCLNLNISMVIITMYWQIQIKEPQRLSYI